MAAQHTRHQTTKKRPRQRKKGHTLASDINRQTAVRPRCDRTTGAWLDFTEARFRRVDDRTQEGYAQLEQDRRNLFKPGEITLLVPEIDEIHQMDNFTNRPTVEIHVYGKDLRGWNRHRYDLESGRIIPFATEKYDNC
jgi:hypothetical protein